MYYESNNLIEYEEEEGEEELFLDRGLYPIGLINLLVSDNGQELELDIINSYALGIFGLNEEDFTKDKVIETLKTYKEKSGFSLLKNCYKETLFDILDSVQFNQVIIFVNNIARCETLSDILEKNKFPAVAIHADLPQEERIKKFDRFKDFKTRIMVATELYGRGVDFLKVNTVINYDMSTDAEAYVHRVGRAGRFGTKGITITFLASEEDQKVFDDLLKKYPNIKAEALPDVIDKSIYSKFLYFNIFFFWFF